jgi:hypothetical protein
MPALTRLPSLPSLGTRLPGVPAAPRVEGITGRFLQPYPDPPPGFVGPRTEWVVYENLVFKRKFVEGVDFDRQVALSASGINSKGFNRADFAVWATGKNGAAGGVYTRAIVLNPISFYTHRSRAKDIFERAVLAAAGFGVMYLQDTDLYTRPNYVISLGLRGIDISSRGLGYR